MAEIASYERNRVEKSGKGWVFSKFHFRSNWKNYQDQLEVYPENINSGNIKYLLISLMFPISTKDLIRDSGALDRIRVICLMHDPPS